MYNIILGWARLFLRLYFRRTIVHGLENIPKEGPLILASNHPSAFMEASVLATLMGRQLHFLVRGDVFNPKFRWLFKWTNQIPIYRQKDGISNLRKNASSFDLTYQKLAEGSAVIIFPEAKTILEKKMRPIQRGTAHLAFGTLAVMKPGQALTILPVGVNFTDPRLPGTDVVVSFGKAYTSMPGTREDREAIETFTQTLSDALQPLVIEIHDVRHEKRYDVLASLYLKSNGNSADAFSVHQFLQKIATEINEAYDHALIKKLDAYTSSLRKQGVREAIYFPSVTRNSKPVLMLQLIAKAVWFIAGGWIWRSVRKLIFSKLKTDTFQGPTSLGAAMVIFPLVSLILAIVLWSLHVPLWWILVWWIVLAAGKLIPEPLSLVWRMIAVQPKMRRMWRDDLEYFKKALGN